MFVCMCYVHWSVSLYLLIVCVSVMESYLAIYLLANIKNIVRVLVYVIVFLVDAD